MGLIVFGLVNVLVKVYSVIVDYDIRFYQVYVKDNGCIWYKCVCEVCGEVVDYCDFVWVYEFGDG